MQSEAILCPQGHGELGADDTHASPRALALPISGLFQRFGKPMIALLMLQVASNELSNLTRTAAIEGLTAECGAREIITFGVRP